MNKFDIHPTQAIYELVIEWGPDSVERKTYYETRSGNYPAAMLSLIERIEAPDYYRGSNVTKYKIFKYSGNPLPIQEGDNVKANAQAIAGGLVTYPPTSQHVP